MAVSAPDELGQILRRAVGLPGGPQAETELPTGRRGPAPYPLTDTDDPSKYAFYSRALLEEQRAVMGPLYINWTQNLLFIAGLQWWKYDPVVGTFVMPIKKPWEERPVRNVLVSYWKTFLGKITKNRPVCEPVPGSTEPDDLKAAALAKQVLEAKEQELDLSGVRQRAAAWVFGTGNAFVLPFWNPDAGILHPLTAQVLAQKHDATTGEPVMQPGPAVPHPETGEPVPGPDEPVMEQITVPCDEQGNPQMTEDGSYDTEADPAYVDLGEAGFRVLSPFQVFVDPAAESERDVTFYLVVEPLTITEVYRRWPQVKSVPAEDTTQIDRFSYMVSLFAAGADTHLAASLTRRDQGIPKTLVLHYYERPNQQHPKGRYWCTCGDQMLEPAGSLPDELWPAVRHIKDIEVAGRFHGEATLTAAVGLQREYNERTAQIKEHDNLMAKGKYLVPYGAKVARGTITNQPAEVIQHTPGLEPKQMRIEPLPAAVYEERDRVLQDMEQVMGLHGVSMGKAPPGVSSGRAFLTLQEADDGDLAPFLERFENLTAGMGWDLIRLVQRNYKQPRLLQAAGKDTSYRVRSFTGADLTGVVNVRPQAGSAFPWSASARQSFLVELGQSMPMLFTDPETGTFDAERFRRLLPLGGTEAVDLDADVDVNEALREEEEFRAWDGQPQPPDPATGQPGEPELPFPLPWQNHRIHLRQHARLLKSAEFRDWPEANQQAMVQHWMATQQAMAPPPLPPGPGGPGGPPGPGGGPPTPAAGPPPAVPGAPAPAIAEGQQDINNVRQQIGADVPVDSAPLPPAQ